MRRCRLIASPGRTGSIECPLTSDRQPQTPRWPTNYPIQTAVQSSTSYKAMLGLPIMNAYGLLTSTNCWRMHSTVGPLRTGSRLVPLSFPAEYALQYYRDITSPSQMVGVILVEKQCTSNCERITGGQAWSENAMLSLRPARSAAGQDPKPQCRSRLVQHPPQADRSRSFTSIIRENCRSAMDSSMYWSQYAR